MVSHSPFLPSCSLPPSTGLRFEENADGILPGGPLLLEMEKKFNEISKPEFVAKFVLNTVLASRAASKKGKKDPKSSFKLRLNFS